jgi:type II secretory pathway pseudopilin PulG
MRDRANRPSPGVLVDQVIGRSFGLLETAVVVLIVVALAAGAAPVYVGYTRAARTVEGRALATSLWTAIQAHAVATCGNPVGVAAGFSNAGLDPGGSTAPARWSIISDAFKTVTTDCTTGAIRPDGDVFTLGGAVKDIGAIRVKVTHAALGSPPTQLLCSVDGGASFKAC